MTQQLWKILLHQSDSKNQNRSFRVLIEGHGERVIEYGPTPSLAYERATAKLIIKPWLENVK